jgi:hypothetical protein
VTLDSRWFEMFACAMLLLVFVYMFGTCIYERPCGGGIYHSGITQGQLEASENARRACIEERYPLSVQER